jgi:hypothetical protein
MRPLPCLTPLPPQNAIGALPIMFSSASFLPDWILRDPPLFPRSPLIHASDRATAAPRRIWTAAVAMPPTVRARSRTIYSKSRRRLTLPFSSKLQGHTFITAGHQSSPTAVERRCPKPLAPPRCWPTSLVCFCPLLLARPYLGVPLVLTGSTLPSASRYRATGESVTMLPRACHVAGRGPFSPLDRAARPRPTRLFGRPRMAENGSRPNTVHEFSNLF